MRSTHTRKISIFNLLFKANTIFLRSTSCTRRLSKLTWTKSKILFIFWVREMRWLASRMNTIFMFMKDVFSFGSCFFHTPNIAAHRDRETERLNMCLSHMFDTQRFCLILLISLCSDVRENVKNTTEWQQATTANNDRLDAHFPLLIFKTHFAKQSKQKQMSWSGRKYNLRAVLRSTWLLTVWQPKTIGNNVPKLAQQPERQPPKRSFQFEQELFHSFWFSFYWLIAKVDSVTLPSIPKRDSRSRKKNGIDKNHRKIRRHEIRY